MALILSPTADVTFSIAPTYIYKTRVKLRDITHLFQDLQVGVFLAILISGVRYILPLKIWNDSIHTLFQLQMLVLVNMFLEPFTEILANRMSLENVVVAFNVILLVDMVMATVKANSR